MCSTLGMVPCPSNKGPARIGYEKDLPTSEQAHSPMKLIEIKEEDKKLAKEFIRFPVRLHKNHPQWIRPLDKDIEDVFHPKTNKFFRHGECTRWLLQNQEGKTIGRVAAFIDRKEAKKQDQPTGGLGFFECIDDQDAANMLFDQARAWLEQRGMEAMDGSINFGNRDRWWGIQTDGYEFPPNYGMLWHPPYYKELFEAYGFQVYYNQLTFHRKVLEGALPQKTFDKAERIRRNPDYKLEHINKKELDKYAEEFRLIYNKAWVKHGVGKMGSAQAKLLMKKMKPVLDERIIWFAYYKEEPIGFFIMLPELNQIFKHVNGKMDLVGKIKFVYHQWAGTVDKIFGVAFGVVPEHQGKGLEGAFADAPYHLFLDLQKNKKMPYEDFEMNWIGDFNVKMIHLAEQIGCKVRKVHSTYRYLFDPNKAFKRHPEIK